MNVAYSLNLAASKGGFSESGEAVDSAQPRQVQTINEDHVMSCQQSHEKNIDERLLTFIDNSKVHVKGDKKCCQCAYNSGYKQGALLQEFISLDVESLGDIPESADGKYRSVHQAFAIGYQDGVDSFIKSQ